MLPILLPPNPVQHFYRGGDRIAALRGIEQRTDHQPEEWLGSTVARFGDGVAGLAVDERGAILRDLIAADPEGWTGGPGRDASDTGMLVKLLDARQRLPVHVHPSRGFAATHLDCPYGKTEAWYVLDSTGDGAVYLGWREAVDREELDRRRDAQDSEWLLDRMNRIPVEPGTGVLCPAGTVHAIGEGVFVAEIQEPTDFSILLEWSVTTSTREESHLDLGFDAVMPAVSLEALAPREIERLTSFAGRDEPRPGEIASLLPEQADPYFRLLRACGGDGLTTTVPAGFSVVLATSGAGRLVSGTGSVPIARGQAYAVPRAFGAWGLTDSTEALVFLPGAGWPGTLGAEGL
ncbi:phosphoheptose isomerase [Leucobacter zeae]|nr:phosphoheptose isomerase [Leucobacter zeae]